MKVKNFLLVFLTVVLAGLAACSDKDTDKDISGADGSTAGKATGTALMGLYNQYKTDGNLDLGNTTNLLNITSLAAAITDIKNAEKGTNYYTTFASGLITGSSQKVTSSTVDNVISGLTAVDYGTLTDKDATASEKTSSAISGLTSILNLLN